MRSPAPRYPTLRKVMGARRVSRTGSSAKLEEGDALSPTEADKPGVDPLCLAGKAAARTAAQGGVAVSTPIGLGLFES